VTATHRPKWALVLTAVAVIWVIALSVAPRMAGSNSATKLGLVAPLYAIGSVICHQRPERSFQFAGVAWPVCARCTGIYAGAALGALVALIGERRAGWSPTVRRARLAIAVAAVPTVATLLFEWLTGVAPLNITRFLAGGPLGAAVAWVIVAATGSTSSVEVH
jgi:uncharacterized membrane protein